MQPEALCPERERSVFSLGRLALVAWILAVLIPCVRTALFPHTRSVYPAYSYAGANWLAGEELYFTAPEGREFAARCRRPDPSAVTPNTCQAELRMDDVDVEIRFSAMLLSEWRRLRGGARSFVASARR